MDKEEQSGLPIVTVQGGDQGQVSRNLEAFEQLDFTGWNGPDWDVFRQRHADDVHVEGFGATTDGIEPHVNWAQEFIEGNPDTYTIEEHQIRIGAGDWTAVTGRLVDGTVLATFARWENGRIAEEYLFTLSS